MQNYLNIEFLDYELKNKKHKDDIKTSKNILIENRKFSHL